MMISDCLVHPVDFFVWVVERVSSAHLEHQIMSSESRAYVVYVRESDAWLTYYERIGGGRDQAFRDVRLKIIDRRSDQEDVVSPPCNYWVRSDSFMSVFLEE